MTREEYIDEFKDYIVTMIKDSGYLEPEEVLDVVEYRLQWLFDNYTFINKE